MVSKQILSARDQIQCVKLPKLYLRNEIPVDPSEVATQHKLKKWGYLDCVGSKIASDDTVSINVLIGALQRLWNQLISLQVKMEILMLWILMFWVGVLSDTLKIVAKKMMSLAAKELLFKMQKQSKYPAITLKSRRK